MLYKLNKNNQRETYKKVKRVTLADIGWKEKDLEKLIAQNICDFVSSNDLMTLFTERPRKEEPDILALDKNGELYIFELKRWEGKQENLLQVLRYGQLFGKSDYDELNSMFHKTFGDKEDLVESHALYFFGDKSKKIPEEKFNNKQHFVIVTNGIDQQTVESIIYWRNTGISIDAIVYWVFEIEGEYYIEFNTYSQMEDYLEYENNCYVLNTNENNNKKHTEDMLIHKKAAAYYPGWREKIKKFQKGDIVFLYKSGVGIIAYGYADGVLKKADCDGNKDYEYYMNLDKFVELESPVSASKMKEITECGLNFRQTLFSISQDKADKILEFIKNTK
ncbi:MAG: hypothetical protein IJ330_06240 [Oscillospiraceae bacterium]|nr:hypothetical protein [Oscillospiraceae bacterium]